MTLLAVKGFPRLWGTNHVKAVLSKVIPGQFKILNAQISPSGFKTVYVKLSERLNPAEIIENIRVMSETKSAKLSAYITDKVPAVFNNAGINKKIPGGPGKVGAKKNVADLIQKARLIAHREILTELQIKYPALHNLSRKTYHKLLDDIGRTIMERLEKVANAIHGSAQCPSSLGAAYRKSHPHFGDFQLIVSALHRLQDAAGAPRCPLQEKQLLPAAAEKSKKPANKSKTGTGAKCYTERVLSKLVEHVNSLNTEVSEGDTEEDSARKRVREELKKILPAFPSIVHQVLHKQFVPEKLNTYKIRIYGEPHLPGRAALVPVLARLGAPPAARSPRAYNMLALRVPPPRLHALLALDGTTISGAKLVVRSADIPIYRGVSSHVMGAADEEFDAPED